MRETMRPFRFFALIAALLFLSSGQALAAFADRVIRPAEPTPVPPFVFVDEQGGQHALADYRGKYVLLNIWATWCAPCVREMPALDTLQPQFDARGFVILPVAEERAPFLVSAFYQRYALSHLPVMVDRPGVAPQRFGLRGLPVSILIDPQGREIARIEGDAEWASAEAVTFLDNEMGLPKR
jgi:thiol-disulfide isomerase/thioredoxin